MRASGFLPGRQHVTLEFEEAGGEGCGVRRFQLLQGFVVGLLVEQNGRQPQAGQIPDFVLAVFGRPGQLGLGRLQVTGLERLAGGNAGRPVPHSWYRRTSRRVRRLPP